MLAQLQGARVGRKGPSLDFRVKRHSVEWVEMHVFQRKVVTEIAPSTDSPSFIHVVLVLITYKSMTVAI
jgi:hypothetical protein